ncbi:MAG: hypothetical protein ED559_01205 [Phycisphaera sp.]|nr:MAG: hypothetical protein ED559_01205 [Phycisphaera sp.]
MLDDLFDRAHLHAVFLDEFGEIWQPRHRAVGVTDLDPDRCRRETRELAEIDRSLGLTDPDEHPAVACPQRVDVSGSHEVGGDRARIERHLDGLGALCGADTGRKAVLRVAVDRDHQGRTPNRSVCLGLWVQVQPVAVCFGQRDEQVARRLAHHEVDRLGGDELGGHHDVALVLAVLVVRENDHLALSEIREDLVNRAECGIEHPPW